jgi:hypothetical protein
MKKIKALLLGAAVVMVAGSIPTGADASPATFLRRMYRLRSKYRGHVHIAKMDMGRSRDKRPAIFINTDFGRGEFHTWTSAQQQKFNSFQRDLSKALGTNTIRIWNPHEPGTDQGGDWLQVASCKGYNPRLEPQNRNKHWSCYSSIREREPALPQPGQEQTNVLVKLKNPQLTAFNKYINAIKRDYRGTLGETNYNGGTPPYVSGRSTGSHNCTSWMTSWLKKEVGNGFRYGADPPSWCKSTACDPYARSVRGVVVFNHPNAPHTGQTISRNFQLSFAGEVNTPASQ